MRVLRTNNNNLDNTDFKFIDSEVLSKNKARINELLCQDENVIQALIDQDYDDGIEPVFAYHEILSYGIEFVTKIKDGNVVREVIESKALDEAVSNYYIRVNNGILVFYPCCMLGGYSYVDYDDIKSKEIDDFIAKNNLEIIEIDSDEVQDFLEGIRRFNYKESISIFINEDFNEKNDLFKSIGAIFLYDKVERIVHGNKINQFFVDTLNYLIDLGLDVHDVKYLITQYDDAHPKYFSTLKNGAKVKTWQGNARALKGLASAFKWLQDNKGINLNNFEIEIFYAR